MMPDGSREYTPERRAMHRKLIDDYLQKHGATATRGDPPEVLFLGGLGGSGKSSFGDKAKRNPLGVYKEKDFMVADADKIKELMPEYSGDKAAMYHEESSHILKQLLAHAQDAGINTVIDGTLSSPKTKLLQSFKDCGFKTGAFYMFVPPEIAAARALERWRGEGPGKRGRLVPPSIILASTQNPANYDSLLKVADHGGFYDNTGDKPKKVSIGG
jgi:predicted ABC-type ATPase